MLFKEAFSKQELSQLPLIELKNYQYSDLEQGNMCNFQIFCAVMTTWTLFATLEANQRLVNSNQNKRTNMVVLGCILPNLAKICFHKSIHAIFFHSQTQHSFVGINTRGHGWWTIHCVYKEPFVDETVIPDSTISCETVVGMNASQLNL